MKKFFILPVCQDDNLTAGSYSAMYFTKKRLVLFAFLLCTYVLPGCSKEQINLTQPTGSSQEEVQPVAGNAHSANAVPIPKSQELNKQTEWELQQVRAATAKYRHIKNAVKDGYVDINAVVPNMGHHYMKASLVDSKFELRNPEILVYDKLEDGSFELVAVEYAVPIGLSPKAPQGFTGSNDVWERNDALGMWFLHAWVWLENPSGVFNPTNPMVHVH